MITALLLALAMQAVPKQELDGRATTSSELVIGEPTPTYQVEIFSNDDKGRLLAVMDPHRTVILTVFRDGHVEAADPTKIDESAKQFWLLFAKYMPEYCKSLKP
jgi:hypothetical protein